MTLLLAILVCAACAVAFALTLPLRHESSLTASARRSLTLCISLFVLIAAGGLYYFLGAATWLDDIARQQERNAALRATITQHMQDTQHQPDNAAHWAALGEAWVEAQDFTHAAEAWRKAVLTSGGHPDFIAQYAAALVMQNDGMVSEDALGSIAMALKLNPQQPLARKLETLWHEQQSRNPVVETRD